MNFITKLNSAISKNNSLLCIGLDTDITKIPKHLLELDDPVFEFNKAIINETANLVCSFKLNIAYYSANGIKGLESLIKTIEYIHNSYTGIPVILDAKRADVGSTSKQYAKEVFDILDSDAVTVNPYFGIDSLEPFLEYKDKGIIILCKTSNPSASDFQDLMIGSPSVHLEGEIDTSPKEIFEPLYIKVAKKIYEWNKKYQNCLMVVGATYPNELKLIREIAPEMFFLVPGIGKQGGDLEKTLEYGLTKDKSGLTPIRSGLIIHSARGIIYASNDLNFSNKAKDEAEKLKEEINKYRK